MVEVRIEYKLLFFFSKWSSILLQTQRIWSSVWLNKIQTDWWLLVPLIPHVSRSITSHKLPIYYFTCFFSPPSILLLPSFSIHLCLLHMLCGAGTFNNIYSLTCLFQHRPYMQHHHISCSSVFLLIQPSDNSVDPRNQCNFSGWVPNTLW